MRFKAELKIWLILLASMLTSTVSAQNTPDLGSSGSFFEEQEPDFLPEEQAFVFDFSQQGDKLTLRWQIAEGYYLYKKQFKFVAKRAEIGEVSFPPAAQIEDEFFGVSDVYFQQAELVVDIKAAEQNSVVKVRYQGCAEAGLCYPPTTREVYLSSLAAIDKTSATDAAITEQDKLKQLLATTDNHLLALGLFFVLGVGLAFTPCVFPMYPILSGIIVGQGDKLKTRKAFTLSFVYVQGMALTYSALGLIVASAGLQYQTALQHPVVLISLSILFGVLALSMFGVYEFSLPASWQQRLTNVSNKQQGGQIAGVFVMGVLSGLVASPCTTAPLSGALLYVAQSGDLLFGGSALYALSLGMGLPLLVIGTSGGKLLPKAGAWMNVVKVTFGFMLLAVAVLLLSRLLNEVAVDALWSLLIVATFSYFFTINSSTKISFWKGIRSFIIFIGLFVGAVWGYQTWLTFNGYKASANSSHPVEFTYVKDFADIQQQVAKASEKGHFVMLDLYADWCVACKQFEKYTFPAPQVVERFNGFTLLQADLSENTPTTVNIMKSFDVLGLPTMLFFDQSGKELTQLRVTGFMNAEVFAQHLDKVVLQK